jgi:hypothetical protein
MRWRQLVPVLTLACACSSKNSLSTSGTDGGRDATDRTDAAVTPEENGAPDSPPEVRVPEDGAPTDTPFPRDSSGEVGGEAGGRDETGAEVAPAGAEIVVSTAVLDLGRIDIATRGVGTLTLTNRGKTASGPLTIVVSAGLTATGCVGSLAPGASCLLTVTVIPSASGTFAGTLAIAANPGTPVPLVVAVRATVTSDGLFTVSPPTVDLGTVPVGMTASTKLTVTAVAAITDLTFLVSGAELAIDKMATTCTATLGAGASCVIVVKFLAATTGKKSDTVVITSGGSALSVPITASVMSNSTRLAINPTTAAFAASIGQSSSPVSFGVINLGDVATGLLEVKLAGASAADFSIASNNCLVLAPLTTCTVTVVFRPSYLSTTRVATLVVTDTGASTSSVSAALSGTPFGSPEPSITSTKSDLGAVLVGGVGTSVDFTVANYGDVAVGPLTVAISSSEFVITRDTCSGVSLAKSETCTIAIALKPTTVGAKVATLSVTPANGSPAVKTMTGTGVSG